MHIAVLAVQGIQKGAEFWVVNPDGSKAQVRFNVTGNLDDYDLESTPAQFMNRVAAPIMLPLFAQIPNLMKDVV